jgi:cellobiose phosphorylase
MQYGTFDDLRREYVINNPRSPVKWINYLGSLSFGGFIDQTGGALICKGDPALNRIVKYLPQLPASSFKGTTLYLRLAERDGYRLIAPFYVPCLDHYAHYECRVGLGYTRFLTEVANIQTEAIFFVPPGQDRLVWDIHITNLSEAPQILDAIPLVEYTHFDALKQLTNADWVPQTMQSKAIHDTGGTIVLLQYAFMRRETHLNYLTSNLPVASFESRREAFLGDHEYGTWARPLALLQPELGNGEALRGENIASLLHHLGELAPGETRRLIVQLGQATNLEEALSAIQAYRQPENVEAAFECLRSFWEDYLAGCQVETPVLNMNRMLNVHNPRQCYITKNWSRYLSLYQLGFGARGIGFRDSSQDVMGILNGAPQEGKALIRQLLQVQKRDGSAMHQFNPLTMQANPGDSVEIEDAPKYYSDDHLWIVLAITSYLKESGDLGFLSEVIPYYEKDKSEQPLESGSVLDHMRRAVEFTRGDCGAHGLPRLGFADWNDTVNLRLGAESLFTANLYGKALLEMIELAEELGDADSASRYRRDYADMRLRVNQHGWDGAWYLRYFDADGTPLGSHDNPKGQIYLNAQSWAVISGFAPLDRARLSMDSVYRLLNTHNGIKLSAPGYNGYDPAKGGITTYAPGAKENGGIFLHANPWAIIAETLLGNGERAFEYYQQINPASKNELIEEFESEPYVYPQNILGDEHPQFGLARNSWLTGTASWAYQAATCHILGLQPAYRGLRIDPCIPTSWEGFRVRRHFRQAWYEIQVHNPRHVSHGVQSILVDGQPLSGNLLPLFEDGQTHPVYVELGCDTSD